MKKVKQYYQIQKELFSSNKIMLLFLYFCKIVSSALVSIITILTANLISLIIKLVNDTSSLKEFIILIVTIFILSLLKELIGSILSNVILQKLKDKYVKDTQFFMFDKIQKVDNLDLSKNIFKNKITNYQSIVKNPIIISDLDVILTTIFGIVSQLVVLTVYFNWQVIIIFSILLIFSIVYMKIINQHNEKEYEIIEQTRDIERVTGYYGNLLFEQNVYMENKLYSFKDYFLKKFLKVNTEYNELNNKVQYKYNKIELTFSIIGIVIMNIFIISYLYFIGNKDIGVLLSIISVFDLLLFYIMDLQYASTALNRVNKMFEYGKFLKDYIKEKESSYFVEQEESNKHIELRNVNFKYDTKGVLNDVSITIEKGEHIAIVGENGSGKSTLIKILMGILKPIDGVVTINNEDPYFKLLIKGESNCALMSQDIVKYKGITLEENVTFGKVKDIDFDEFEEYRNRIIGPEYKGMKFSTGQWRQIILKRIIYSNKDIIIMDEPDESLDVFKESKMYQLIQELFKNKTVIFVTHRLNNIKRMDRIIFMQNGYVVDDGSFDQLMCNGEFNELYNSQSKWYKESRDE